MPGRCGWEGFSPAGPNATRWIAEVAQLEQKRSTSAEPRLRARMVNKEPWHDARQHAFQRLAADWWEPAGRSWSPSRRRGLLVGEKKKAQDSEALPPYLGWPTAGPTGDNALLKSRGSLLRGHVDWVQWSEETRDVLQRHASPNRRPAQRQNPDGTWCVNYGVVGPGQAIYWPGELGIRSEIELPPAMQSRLPMQSIDKQDNIYRIVLTGGPCGGKSSALPRLQASLEERGFDVYVIPSTMSVLQSVGSDMTQAHGKHAIVTFVRSALRMQLRIESAFLQLAKSTKKPSIILLEQGVMDLGVHLDATDWKIALDAVGMSEDQLLARYDMVLHFVTVADGKPEIYAHGETVDDAGNAVTRAATAEVALVQDSKHAQIWRRHPHVRKFDNAGMFDDKVQQALNSVSELVTPIRPVSSTLPRTPVIVNPIGSSSSPRNQSGASASKDDSCGATLLARAQDQLRAALSLADQAKAPQPPPKPSAPPSPPPFSPPALGQAGYLQAMLASAQEAEECFSRHGLGVANVSVSFDGSGSSALRVVHAGNYVDDEAGQSAYETKPSSEPTAPMSGTLSAETRRSMMELADAMSNVHAKVAAFRTKVNSISVM